MQRVKWVLCVTVPIWFGYGFARDPANLEWVKRTVGLGGRKARGRLEDHQGTHTHIQCVACVLPPKTQGYPAVLPISNTKQHSITAGWLTACSRSLGADKISPRWW